MHCKPTKSSDRLLLDLILLALLSLPIAVPAYLVAPQSDDLYNLIYAHSRPKVPEPTFVFIFFFPVLQALLIPAFIISDHDGRTKRNAFKVIPVIISVVFLAITVFRCVLIFRNFG